MEETVAKGTLIVEDRSSLTLDGVDNVLGFDEEYVSLETRLGKIVIEGRTLKIESLSKENGVILISGRINGILYSDEKPAKGVFARLFK